MSFPVLFLSISSLRANTHNPLFAIRSHYGEEFRLDCVDARTDEVVGTALLSTQGILQMQRDETIQRDGALLVQCFRGPIVERGTRPGIKLMLRKGVKNAFGLEFYVSSREMSLEAGGAEFEKGTTMVDPFSCYDQVLCFVSKISPWI